MNSKAKKFWAFFWPSFLLVAGVTLLVGFELYLKDRINTVPVVVAKEDIPFKEKITADDLVVVNVRTDHAIAGAMNEADIPAIVESYAAIDIKKGTQIYDVLVDHYNLIPNEKEGEFVAPVPADWIYAVPGSLRRSYVADFYAVPDSAQQIKRTVMNEDELNRAGAQFIQNTEPILTDVRVSSVQSGQNKEVQDSPETTGATGTISTVEIIANQEMLDTMNDAVQEGYKILIVYKYER